jgi:hypothetical protein
VMADIAELEPITRAGPVSRYQVQQDASQTNTTQVLLIVPDELADFGPDARAKILRGLKQGGSKYRGSFAQFAG